MSLEVGVDSFVTLAEADAYHADRTTAEAWEDLDDEREGYLVSAYDKITSSCAFSFDPATAEAPDFIKKAQSELAYRMSLLAPVEEESGTRVTELKAGPATIKFEHEEAPDGVTTLVENMLAKGGAVCDFSASSSVMNGIVVF